jgi:peptidoglycan/xylan/chitin deacetylase (PgdA/CDA1 family)
MNATSDNPLLQHGGIAGDNQPNNAFPDNTVTLTYDDGPDAYTLDIGAYLRDQGIRATFFVRTCRLIGQTLADPGAPVPEQICLKQCAAGDTTPGCGQFPASWLQTLKDMGHRIANHTMHHYPLDSANISSVKIVSEVLGAQALLDPYVTDGVYAFRPPYHGYNATVAAAINSEPALWKLTGPAGDDVDANDWQCAQASEGICEQGRACTPQECAQLYYDKWSTVKLHHNGIVQMHNGNEFSPGTDFPLRLTMALVPLLKGGGARFVPLDAVPGITGTKTFGTGEYRSSDFSDAAGWNSASSYYESIQLADVGGDALPDVCGRSSAGIQCGIADASGFAAADLWTSTFSDSDGFYDPKYGSTIHFGNIDGSGKADVCGRGIGGVFCAPSTGAGFGARTQWTSDFSDAQGWDTTVSYYGSIRLVDVDGDGNADICARGWAGIYCALSTGSGFDPKVLLSTDFSDNSGWFAAQYGSTIQFADVNGDGRMDVCGRGALGMWCATGKTDVLGFNPATLWSQWGAFSDADGWDSSPAYYRSIHLGSVDGGALPAVCGRTATGLVCAFSDGTQFTDYVHVRNDYFTDSLGWSPPEYGSTLQLADISGDGHADLCGRGNAGIYCVMAP